MSKSAHVKGASTPVLSPADGVRQFGDAAFYIGCDGGNVQRSFAVFDDFVESAGNSEREGNLPAQASNRRGSLIAMWRAAEVGTLLSLVTGGRGPQGSSAAKYRRKASRADV